MNETERAVKDFEDFKVAGYTHCALPSSWHIELAITALRAQLERENPQPLTYMFSEMSGRWGKCQKCGKINRYEYNYCAECGTRICPPKEDAL